jgi:peptidoglycan/xylan/chitin deacetylase (PgdA/CDA1 family)
MPKRSKKPKPADISKELRPISALCVIILFIYGLIGWNFFALKAESMRNYVNTEHNNQKFEVIGRSVSEASLMHRAEAAAAPTQKISSQVIPTMIYHKTPDNFEEQLIALRDRGYTTITMAELNDIVRGNIKGPAKPVAITFDDGFSDQLRAFDLLKKYNMKATYYIIVGGERSGWCIGTERKNFSCGDAYLGWDQIKSLMNSGLIEIGSHTINHLSLPSQSLAVQKDEIITSKSILEQKLGINITSFAYPYGMLNDQLAQIVRQAGYTNATGTSEGNTISVNNIFNIPRLRSTLKLP